MPDGLVAERTGRSSIQSMCPGFPNPVSQLCAAQPLFVNEQRNPSTHEYGCRDDTVNVVLIANPLTAARKPLRF